MHGPGAAGIGLVSSQAEGCRVYQEYHNVVSVGRVYAHLPASVLVTIQLARLLGTASREQSSMCCLGSSAHMQLACSGHMQLVWSSLHRTSLPCRV